MTSEKIAKEYSQWLFAQRLLAWLRKATKDFTPNKHRSGGKIKLENAFGRWLTAVQFFSLKVQESSEFLLFPRMTLGEESSRGELIRLLNERFSDMSEVQAAQLADEMHGKIIAFIDSDHHRDSSSFVLKYEKNGSSGCISVEEFRSPECTRVRFLVDKIGLADTALACMRYDSLAHFKGGESGLSITAFNALHDLGGATHEGFASPINCRLLGRPNIKFCSLFADTDSAFGSLGNFFLINLSEHPGGWILNPPFIEPVLEATARRVVGHLQEAEQGSFWFYIAFPMWEDCEAWHILDQSEWKVAMIDLDEGSFVIQDCYGDLVWSDCGICIFVLGQLPKGVDLMKLRDRISCMISCTGDRRVEEKLVEDEWKFRCT